MNGALIGSVAVLAVMTCLNLLLTYGLIRRVREHDEKLAQTAGTPSLVPEPAIGTPLRAFAAETVDGLRLTEQGFTTGVAYLGFFSTTCPPCREQLPKFVDAVAGLDTSRTLVVVVDDHPAGEGSGSFVEMARAAGLVVVVEEPLGPVADALGVNKLPTMVLLDDGIVAASGTSVDHLPLPVLAAGRERR